MKHVKFTPDELREMGLVCGWRSEEARRVAAYRRNVSGRVQVERVPAGDVLAAGGAQPGVAQITPAAEAGASSPPR